MQREVKAECLKTYYKKRRLIQRFIWKTGTQSEASGGRPTVYPLSRMRMIQTGQRTDTDSKAQVQNKNSRKTPIAGLVRGREEQKLHERPLISDSDLASGKSTGIPPDFPPAFLVLHVHPGLPCRFSVSALQILSWPLVVRLWCLLSIPKPDPLTPSFQILESPQLYSGSRLLIVMIDS
jgi:hypothetical protein